MCPRVRNAFPLLGYYVSLPYVSNSVPLWRERRFSLPVRLWNALLYMEKSSNFPKHSKERPVSRLDPTSTLPVLIGQCDWKRCWRRAHWHSMHSFIMCSQKDEGKKEWETRGKVQLGLTLAVLQCVKVFVTGWCVKRGPHLEDNRGDDHVFSNHEMNMFMCSCIIWVWEVLLYFLFFHSCMCVLLWAVNK